MKLFALALAVSLIASGNAAPHDPLVNLAVRENDQSEWKNFTVQNNQVCTNFENPMTETRLDPHSLPDDYPFACSFFRGRGCQHGIKYVGSEHPQETFKPALSVRCPQNPFENGVPHGGDDV